MVAVPDIEFRKIRSFGQPPTRANGFEELSSLLIEQWADWPAGTRFDRFGNPDGGREGRGILPNGDVWAWQSKFLFKFDDSAVAQLKKSLLRTLETEPNLRRYLVALPINLPAGDTAKAKSANTRWEEAVTEWKTLAADCGVDVEFKFMGEHYFFTTLTTPDNAGRARYWFDADTMTPIEQQRHIDDIIAKLGHRYSPELHVEVDTVQTIDALCRASSYAKRWQEILAELRSSRDWRWTAPKEHEAAFQDALVTCDNALQDVDTAIQVLVTSLMTFDDIEIPESKIDVGLEAVNTIRDLLRTHCLSDGGYYLGEAAALSAKVQTAFQALGTAQYLSDSIDTRAAKSGELLLTGRAGVGKTHLLCDVARRRISLNFPSLMVLGQDFDSRSLLTQLAGLAEKTGTIEDLLSLLDAAGEAAGCKALLIIDAINESEQANRWADDLRTLRSKVARFPRIALVLSCRTEFIDVVVGDADIPSVEHFGFDEATDVAVRRFATEYGLDVPTFPFLNPEFGNPLFLRLACEALSTLGQSRFTLGTAGLSTVCGAFIKATNKRLSHPSRCDYFQGQNLVQATIRELAQMEVEYFERSDVDRITSTLLPNRTHSTSLLKGLLDEGILMEIGHDKIAFGYQRLGDIARATEIIAKPVLEIQTWLDTQEVRRGRESGTLAALAILLPETHHVELFDLLTQDNQVPSYAIDGFIDSLTLREQTSITSRTCEIITHLLSDKHIHQAVQTQLIRLACVPNHPLNARWLHEYLSAQELAERDLTWSIGLLYSFDSDEHSPVRTLIEWAWPMDPAKCHYLNPETCTLGILSLGWFLTSSDRRVRDRATKAMVALGESNPLAFTEALNLLIHVNDPYVVDRVTTVACGIALRNVSDHDMQSIAESLADFVSDRWPRHLLVRDHIRRVFGAARETGWEGPDGHPPYGAKWPIDVSTKEEIESLTEPPDYKYSSIWGSLTGMGDFGNYVLEPAIRDLATSDHAELLSTVERAVFDRVCDLGWTPDKFDNVDTRISHWRSRFGRQDGHVERLGKKYQWIAFYEVLGALADNFDLKPDWSSVTERPYEYAEQLIWRDIDATVLARNPSTTKETSLAWSSPVAAEFPEEVVGDYPCDMIGVPDPIDLISVKDTDGQQWLSLLSFPDWKQHHAPHVAALKPPTRDIWMRIHAYLVPSDAVQTLRKWALDKDWFGRWMPEIANPSNLLLGTHPTAPEWDLNDDDWHSSTKEKLPTTFIQCGAWYTGTGTSRDSSAEKETLGFVPTRSLFNLLGLHHGVDFMWKDDKGLAVFDPAPTHGGENTLLLRHDLQSRLHDAGYTLFWTVLTGHEHLPGNHGVPGENHRWISASSSYLLTSKSIEKLDSQAGRYMRGPRKELDINWDTKKTDS